MPAGPSEHDAKRRAVSPVTDASRLRIVLSVNTVGADAPSQNPDGSFLAPIDIKSLFLVHGRRIRAFLTRTVRDADLAADLTQETFLRVADHARANPGAVIAHEPSYLYRTARNVALDHERRSRAVSMETLRDDDRADIGDDRPSPERVAAGRSDLAVVRQAMLALPARTRAVFLLVRVMGLTYRETANRLGISESSVQKHLASAVKHVTQYRRAD